MAEHDRQIQTIRLEPYDDATSVRDRLQFVERRRVLLVYPAGHHILYRKLDLLLIQREATRLQLELALLSDDPDVAEAAHDINMSCFFTTRQARAQRWKTPRNRVRDGGGRMAWYDLRDRATRLKPNQSPAERRMRLVGQVAIAVVMLAAIGFAFVAVIPSATVRLTPAADAIIEPVTITADTNVTALDVATGEMPAQVIRILAQGDTVTIETTGRRELTDSQAQGRVQLTNESSNPVFVPAGTVVSTLDIPPKRFSTVSDATLPPEIGTTADVDVVALGDTVGFDGNIPANSIRRVEGDLETTVTVTNPAPTFGGGVREEAVITEDDFARLQLLGQQAVLQAARNELLLQLPDENQFLVPDSLVLVEERPEWMVYSGQVGDAAESVTLEMRGAVEALVIDQLLAQQLAFITLNQRLPPGREINDASLTYRRESIGFDTEGRYSFQLFVEGSTPFAIDESAVAQRISGMSISEAKRTLESELILDPRQPPQISVTPINFGWMPFLPVRINVEINRDV